MLNGKPNYWDVECLINGWRSAGLIVFNGVTEDFILEMFGGRAIKRLNCYEMRIDDDVRWLFGDYGLSLLKMKMLRDRL